jgi:hypothetical protein
LVELKDAEDAISSLSTDLEALRNKTKHKEMAAAKRIEELPTENETWNAET